MNGLRIELGAPANRTCVECTGFEPATHELVSDSMDIRIPLCWEHADKQLQEWSAAISEIA